MHKRVVGGPRGRGQPESHGQPGVGSHAPELHQGLLLTLQAQCQAHLGAEQRRDRKMGKKKGQSLISYVQCCCVLGSSLLMTCLNAPGACGYCHQSGVWNVHPVPSTNSYYLKTNGQVNQIQNMKTDDWIEVTKSHREALSNSTLLASKGRGYNNPFLVCKL